MKSTNVSGQNFDQLLLDLNIFSQVKFDIFIEMAYWLLSQGEKEFK